MPPRAKTSKTPNATTIAAMKEADASIEEDVVVPRPKMTDPEWSDWILAKMRAEEKDGEGNPRVEGLRRLVEEFLGEVVHSAPVGFEGATNNNSQRATVNYLVKIMWNDNKDDIRSFGALADVYSGNMEEEYARFPAASADTRAEGRALRKALRLNRVITAEEKTMLPVSDSGLGQYIVKSQERGIDKLCKQMDIDVMGFINSGAHQYKHFTHVRYTTAQQMLEQLNKYLQNMARIPENIKGYDADWRKVEE